MVQQGFNSRRQTLAKQLPAKSVAIIPGAKAILRNGDADYRFRQNSDFYYLTGFDEPDALLVITSGESSESILFNNPRNPMQEQWTGLRLGQEGAIDQLGMQYAYPISELPQRLPELLAGQQVIYYTLGHNLEWDEQILGAWKVIKGQTRRGVQAPGTFVDVSTVLHEMRLFKAPLEITCMRRAAELSSAAHLRAMQAASRVTYEYQLEAELLYGLNLRGCRNVAYDSIVAAGANACILHYTDNDKPLKPGELVLIDAGGEIDNYAADITRTFPLSGKFSAEQRALYQIVLKAQQTGIQQIRPGLAWNEIQRGIVYEITHGLCDLGILKGHVDDLITQEAYKPFYMHNSGHWLGLDVHDCGAYKINGTWRLLQPDMVLTVEPGIYIQAGMPGVDERWWNIGIRIEDDILVTENGYENLTKILPTEIADIEAIING